jgi:alginate O-acetyltransferase complex protein AlgI
LNFISFEYVILLLPVIILINIFKGRKIVILFIASIIFYLFSGLFGLVTIFSLILINYYFSLLVLKQNLAKNIYILLVIIINIIFLIFLKLSGTIISDSNAFIYFPLGLSFIVFTILSYDIEIFRGTILPEKNILNFAVYIMYFPKILQGPIERPQQFLLQLKEKYSFNYEHFSYGLKLICWGIFKKTVIADRASVLTDNIFNSPDNYSGIAIILGVLFYSVQIYADFSGYIDIAIGSSNLLGIKLSRNFNSPYFSKSIKEFWDNWHITLSHWLRDYIFLPVSYKLMKLNYLKLNNKVDEKIVYSCSIFVTFAVCGLWHGLSLNFLVWGLLFALFLSFSRMTFKIRKKFRKELKISKNNLVINFIKILFTFTLVSFSWIFFRADNLNDALLLIQNIFVGIPNLAALKDFVYLKSIFSGFGLPETEFYILLISAAGLFIIEFFNKGGNIFNLLNNKPVYLKWASYYIMMFIIIFFSYKGSNQDFIYLQF